ncbi:hypothetical protein PsorP6_002321 [Peronosclerospora sorghi]|uniref:Uncharacterized protein n=1 Tax=Peronosclerospora sorghi TaxID=230839 RepID=A0ACC0WV92_9STRA|nr:hypothetical protein PsorP6_002321 [Peronosclerospora sorghi]
MLRRSSLWRKENEGSLMPAGYFVIGDSGYGLSDWMMVASARTQPKQTSFKFAFWLKENLRAIENALARIARRSARKPRNSRKHRRYCTTFQANVLTVHFALRGQLQLSRLVIQMPCIVPMKPWVLVAMKLPKKYIEEHI